MQEELEEVEGTYACCRKTAAKPFMLSRNNSQAWRQLLKHSFRILLAVQLSGKTHEDSDNTIMIAVLY